MPSSLRSQIQERANRKRRRIVQMFGMPTPAGTKPRKSAAMGKPAYVPIQGQWDFQKFVVNLFRGRLSGVLKRDPEGQVLPQQERED